jgi:hypothetical protein
MKYKINYKASDKITDNPIVNVEQDSNLPLKIKKFIMPIIDKFEKLGYTFFHGRAILDENDDYFLSNNVSIRLRNKEFIDINFLIFYNPKEDAVKNSFISKEAVYNNSKMYISFTKDELKIIDLNDLLLSPPFIEETEQDPIDWVDME